MQGQEQKTYLRDECAIFRKTAERFGGLSNMAPGYPLLINGVRILTSEALYQACRFPHLPEIQKIIIGQHSPMTAKMKSKPYRKDSRPEWDRVRVDIMWWCLRVKLAQNWDTFGDLLLSTEDMPIVEESYKDAFWGAKPLGSDILVGTNVLGRLLTRLRELLRSAEQDRLRIVQPLSIPQFLLLDKPIGVIESDAKSCTPTSYVLAGTTTPIVFTVNNENVQSNCDQVMAEQEHDEPPKEVASSEEAIALSSTKTKLSSMSVEGNSDFQQLSWV
jgi:type I restriction enzyme S subunit